ncbi:MAG: amidohydrolase family protein [Planctomycetes bacterium]|nr:amidohydrolase family protein [Planctomycetota bacterium]
MNTRTTAIVWLTALAIVGPASPQVAIRAKLVHTMAGPSIRDGVVLLRGNVVERVGTIHQIAIPEDYAVRDAAVVTPGFVDAHTVVGISGYLNQDHDQDQVEASSPVQPELRAIDAYNSREPLVEWVRSLGVTTMNTGHGPTALVSGQAAVVKALAGDVGSLALDPFSMVLASFAEDARGRDGKSPGTRAKMVAMLRQALLDVEGYRRKQLLWKEGRAEAPKRDLRKEAFAAVLNRDVPLLITANRAHDIRNALRLQQEFGFRLVLDGAAEAHLMLDEIRTSGCPVFVHPTMQRARGDMENLSFETAAKLHEAGIPFAFQTGFESYVPKTRVLLWEVALAVANGLDPRAALAAMTIEPAKILGIEKRVGSLEPGKDADCVLFDGDPFEYTTHVIGVYVNGELASGVVR